MSQDKAQCAVNGRSLNKGCNAGLSHLWASLRARREAVIYGVASLGKGMPFPARRVLYLTASRLADMCSLPVTSHLGIRRFFILLVWLVPAMVIGTSEYSEEELERWFNSDEFALPRPVHEVNEGQLVFITSTNNEALHHHHNNMTIFPRSLQDGWVMMEQCHTNLDKVAAAQIVFGRDRIRDIQLVSFRNMGKAWIEGPTVQMTDIKANARLCMKAWARALFINDDGSYSLRNGPFMRRFLDGYFPLRVSMVINFAGTGLRPTAVSPLKQKGFDIWRKKDRIGFDTVFEGKLRTEFNFEVETLKTTSFSALH